MELRSILVGPSPAKPTLSRRYGPPWHVGMRSPRRRYEARHCKCAAALRRDWLWWVIELDRARRLNRRQLERHRTVPHDCRRWRSRGVSSSTPRRADGLATYLTAGD